MLLGVVAHKGRVVGVGELVLATVVGHAVAASGRFVQQNVIEHNAFVTRDRSWAEEEHLVRCSVEIWYRKKIESFRRISSCRCHLSLVETWLSM
jgi:hypothetical protein